MKLSEYIVKEYNKGHSALTEEDVEKWIVEWYKTTFKNDALPPQWLADWRKYAVG